MPHIHTEPGQHDLTTCAYIIRIDQGEPRALLHMHKKLKKLLSVGGHVELLETPWQALAHEVREESGYTFDQLTLLQPASRITSLSEVVLHPAPLVVSTQDLPDMHFHTDVSYAFVTNQAPAFALGEGESTDLRWLTLTEIKALSSDEIYENTREIHEFLITEALENWDRVPTDIFKK